MTLFEHGGLSDASSQHPTQRWTNVRFALTRRSERVSTPEPVSDVAGLEPVRSPSRAVARRILAVVLLTFSSALFVLAGVTNVASSLVGSPRSTADEILAVATSTNVRHAVAVKLVDQIRQDVSGVTRREINQHRALLIVAVQGIIADPVTQRLARADIIRAYRAVADQRAVRIDLRPLIYRFTQVMHSIDRHIAIKPPGLRHVVVTLHRRNVALGLAGWFFVVGLVLMALSVIGATLTTGLLVRRARHQYWALGLTLGLPSFAALAGGFAVPGVVGAWHFSDSNEQAIAVEAAKRMSNVIIVTGLLQTLITVIALGAWYIGRGRHRRRRALSLS